MIVRTQKSTKTRVQCNQCCTAGAVLPVLCIEYNYFYKNFNKINKTKSDMTSQLVFSKKTKMNLNKQTIDSNFEQTINNLEEKIKGLNLKKSPTTATKNDLINKINEIKDVFEEYKNFAKNLIEENEKINQNINQNKSKTYSEAAQTPKRPTIPKSKEVVIIYPTNDITSDELKSKLKSKIDIKSIGNIGINSFKKIRNNGIVIECNDKNQCKKLEEKINTDLTDVCKASLPTKKNPRIIIYNLFNDCDKQLTDEEVMKEIKESIITQNIEINNYMKENNENDLITKFFIKSKNENFRHLIIETTPQLRKIIINAQKLNINWSRNSVKDFVSITRCFKCLGFGHSKNNCNVETEKCSACAGPHNHINCKSKNKQKNCINCLKFNQNIKNSNFKPFDTNHDALYSECPSLKRIKNLIISKINYE